MRISPLPAQFPLPRRPCQDPAVMVFQPPAPQRRESPPANKILCQGIASFAPCARHGARAEIEAQEVASFLATLAQQRGAEQQVEPAVWCKGSRSSNKAMAIVAARTGGRPSVAKIPPRHWAKRSSSSRSRSETRIAASRQVRRAVERPVSFGLAPPVQRRADRQRWPLLGAASPFQRRPPAPQLRRPLPGGEDAVAKIRPDAAASIFRRPGSTGAARDPALPIRPRLISDGLVTPPTFRRDQPRNPRQPLGDAFARIQSPSAPPADAAPAAHDDPIPEQRALERDIVKPRHVARRVDPAQMRGSVDISGVVFKVCGGHDAESQSADSPSNWEFESMRAD